MINPNRDPSAHPYRMEEDNRNNGLPDQIQEIKKRPREQPAATPGEFEPLPKKIKVIHAPPSSKKEIFAELFSKANFENNRYSLFPVAVRDVLNDQLPLFKEEPSLIDLQLSEGPEKGCTPLYYACYFRQWNLVKEMLKCNPRANINATPVGGVSEGMTPLLFAAELG